MCHVITVLSDVCYVQQYASGINRFSFLLLLFSMNLGAQSILLHLNSKRASLEICEEKLAQRTKVCLVSLKSLH